MRSMAEIYGEMETIVNELDRLRKNPSPELLQGAMLKGKGLRIWPGIEEGEVIDHLKELSQEYFEAITLEMHGYLEMSPTTWESDKFKLQMLLNGIESKNNRQNPLRDFSRSSPQSLFYYMLKVGFGQ